LRRAWGDFSKLGFEYMNTSLKKLFGGVLGFALSVALLLSCAGDFEPVNYDSRKEGSISGSSSTGSLPSSSSTLASSSSGGEIGQVLSSSSDWDEPLSSSEEEQSSSSTDSLPSSSSNETQTSSSSTTQSSSSSSSEVRYSSLGADAITGTTSRYWDACKPSCVAASSCNISGVKHENNNVNNTCSNYNPQNAFACMNQAPWSVNDSVAYGFAAFGTGNYCGKCYQLQFFGISPITGKTMIVMVINQGISNNFDLMIPGGGVLTGNGFALQSQMNYNGSSISNIQNFRVLCSSTEDLERCVKNMCSQAFTFSNKELTYLKDGCDWYVDWFKVANNPSVLYREIDCPQELKDRY